MSQESCFFLKKNSYFLTCGDSGFLIGGGREGFNVIPKSPKRGHSFLKMECERI